MTPSFAAWAPPNTQGRGLAQATLPSLATMTIAVPAGGLLAGRGFGAHNAVAAHHGVVLAHRVAPSQPVECVWCVVNLTSPTSPRTTNVGGDEFTTRTIAAQVVLGVSGRLDGLPAPTT